MSSDTRGLLGPDGSGCESRSLFLDRFTDPGAKDSGDRHPRRDWFNALRGKPVYSHASDSRRDWITSLTTDGRGQHLFAQLQSRLMVNMAGGVMENAGLCLDRFGLPYIPGSAVKGCARRAALAALREWCETGKKPGATDEDHDNLFTDACKDFSSPAEMFLAIALIFGWSELDWKTQEEVIKGVGPRNDEDDTQFQARCQRLWEERRSDFAWACSGPADSVAPTGQNTTAQGVALGSEPNRNASPEGAAQSWRVIRDTVVRQLASEFHTPIPDDDLDPVKRLPNFAGSVSFLPAYPVDLGRTGNVTPLGKLELDVVSCHHKHYYAEPAEPKGIPHSDPRWLRWQREHEQWQRDWGTAPDTEEPVPVVFPAVAPGHVFTFALAPLRGAETKRIAHARIWLETGLETFGLGAKTNAGYGWFRIVERQPDGSFLGRISETSSSGPLTQPPAAQSPPPPASDYNEVIFRNAVLNRLDRPQEYIQLEREIDKLKKETNAPWLQRVKDYLASPNGKEARKRLKPKDWFPKDWLPS